MEQRRIAISAVHCVGTSSIVHLFDLLSPDIITQRQALRLLRLNLRCLEEMCVPFSWSKRTLKAIQILAKKWKLGDKIYGSANTSDRSTTSNDNNQTSVVQTANESLHQSLHTENFSWDTGDLLAVTLSEWIPSTEHELINWWGEHTTFDIWNHRDSDLTQH